MFSYLRPRSRNNALNSPDTPDTGKMPPIDYSSRFPPPRHSPPSPPPDQDEQYISPVSARAPILPPIPRVASIYGAPEGLQDLDKQGENKGKHAAMPHSRVQSIEEDKVSQSFDSSPQSAGRPRNNFSRPFHTRDGSSTPSEEREKMQQIWRTAAKTAQTADPQRTRPQPTVDTTIVQQAPSVQPIRSASRFYRMPFQDSKISPVAESPQNLSAPITHLRQTSDGAISPGQAYPSAPLPQPTDSQLSLPMPRAKESASPTSKQVAATINNVAGQNRPSRLMRLNPMALLTRRRSSQPASQPEPSIFGSTISQNYVGIRGTRVHDFSAPRPRKVESQQQIGTSKWSPDADNDLRYSRTPNRSGNSSYGMPSRASPERRIDSPTVHTPVFKENLNEKGRDDAQNNNPLDIEDDSEPESYYSSDTESEDETNRDPLLLGDPTFGLFSIPDNAAPAQSFSFIVPSHLAGPPPPPRTPKSRSQTPNNDRSHKSRAFTPPQQAPRSPRSRSQTPSVRSASSKDPRAPRSASTPPPRESRTPSPQLHLPRHSKSNASRFSFDLAGFSSAQEKLLEDKHRQRITKTMRASKISQMSVPETDDGFNSDDHDFGEDIEEEIPGMNDDDDDFPMAKNIANFTLDGASGPSQIKSQLYTHQNTAVNISAPEPSAPSAPPPSVPQPSKSFRLPGTSMFNGQTFTDNDDFYFDDGAISDADLATTGNFDENVFDDPTHHAGQQLQPQLPVVLEQASPESSVPSSRPMSGESNPMVLGHAHQASTDTNRTSFPPPQPVEKLAEEKRSSTPKNDLAVAQKPPADLTQGNLAAYHDALALAAQKAVTDGRFDRDDLATGELDEVLESPAQKDNTADYEEPSDRVTFDDYEQEDDDVIAAANADALDYDGDFYGSEFHFYSTGGSEEADSQYGGKFIADVKRSHSGRANGQDPSLTPITEISEWSTRNSMVSFSMDRGQHSLNAAMQGKGLAQIADSLRDEDEDLSLSSLKRLRQNAFASSATSLGTGGSSKNNSPPSSSGNQTTPRPKSAGKQQAEKTHPLRVQTNEDNDATPIVSPSNSTVKRLSAKGHSRNSSGAESVAYVQESDAEGSRWVVERKRISDDGSIEVLGRTVVEGGRI